MGKGRAVLTDVQNLLQTTKPFDERQDKTSAQRQGLAGIRFSGISADALEEVRRFHGLVFPVVYNDKFYDNLLLPNTWVELGMQY